MGSSAGIIDKQQRGLAAVELAIALPLVVMVMIAVAELGRAFYSYNILLKSTRDGLRYLADNALLETGVIDVASYSTTTQNLIVYGQPTPGTALLKDLVPGNVALTSPDADHVTATVTYTYTPLFAKIPTFGYGDDVTVTTTLTASLTMRAL